MTKRDLKAALEEVRNFCKRAEKAKTNTKEELDDARDA